MFIEVKEGKINFISTEIKSDDEGKNKRDESFISDQLKCH